MRWVRIALAWLLLLLGTGVSPAQSIIERMVNPGPLAKAHATLEPKCDSCHVPFQRAGQTPLCLDCHKPVATDIQSKLGFHGLSPGIQGVECRTCHTDHKGREFDIAPFEAAAFDHRLTDYPLTGAHVKTACASCHPATRKFRDAPSGCNDCHARQDIHKGQFGTQCQDCHSTASWKEVARFDHDRTAFPLRGLHVKVPCAACHKDRVFKGTPLTCVGCHSKDDVHKGKLGTKCESCHAVTGWKAAEFDHDKTEFPLRGAHVKVACKGCHADPGFKDAPPKSCVGCHKKDDVHQGSFGTNCAGCHSVKTWKAATFDHNKTAFPLAGRHKQVECAQCHTSKDFKAAPTECRGCHRDSFHQGRLGPRCESCHTARSWLGATFNHTTQTRFPLTGAHKRLDCHECHSRPVTGRPELSSVCGTCHKKDDVHRGAFGQNCGRCHNTQTFGD